MVLPLEVIRLWSHFSFRSIFVLLDKKVAYNLKTGGRMLMQFYGSISRTKVGIYGHGFKSCFGIELKSSTYSVTSIGHGADPGFLAVSP